MRLIFNFAMNTSLVFKKKKNPTPRPVPPFLKDRVSCRSGRSNSLCTWGWLSPPALPFSTSSLDYRQAQPHTGMRTRYQTWAFCLSNLPRASPKLSNQNTQLWCEGRAGWLVYMASARLQCSKVTKEYLSSGIKDLQSSSNNEGKLIYLTNDLINKTPNMFICTVLFNFCLSFLPSFIYFTM